MLVQLGCAEGVATASDFLPAHVGVFSSFFSCADAPSCFEIEIEIWFLACGFRLYSVTCNFIELLNVFFLALSAIQR